MCSASGCIFLLHLLLACFALRCLCILPLRIFAIAAVAEFCVAWFVAFLGRRQARTGQMQNKCKPGNQGRPKCKKTANLETPASQNAKKNVSLETKAGKNEKKIRKFPKYQKQSGKVAVSLSACMCFALVFGVCFICLLLFCILVGPVSRLASFLHFGRPPLPGLNSGCILGGRGFQVCMCFAFWQALVFRVAFVLHLAGPRPPQPNKAIKSKTKFSSKRKNRQKQNAKKTQTKKRKNQNTRKMWHRIPNAHPVCGPEILISIEE